MDRTIARDSGNLVILSRVFTPWPLFFDESQTNRNAHIDPLENAHLLSKTISKIVVVHQCEDG